MHFLLFVLALSSSPASQAAQFQPAPKFRSAAVQALFQTAGAILADRARFGAGSLASGYAATRERGESDLEVVRQLNHEVAGIGGMEDGAFPSDESAATLARFLLDRHLETEKDETARAALVRLRAAFDRVVNDRSLVVFTYLHREDAGSWRVVNVLDPATGQVLVLRCGSN